MSSYTDPYDGYFTLRSNLTEKEYREVFECCGKAGAYLDEVADGSLPKAELLTALKNTAAEISCAQKICSDLTVAAVPREAFQPLVDKVWKMKESRRCRATAKTSEEAIEIAEKVEEIFLSLSGLADMRAAPVAARRALVKKAALFDVMFADEIKAIDAEDPDNFLAGVTYRNRMAFALGLTDCLIRHTCPLGRRQFRKRPSPGGCSSA
ncbi:MAG: hypothetical protein J7496_16040 [Novosphingobium sp.]|nr:hypothetical protein [Novosphingobium sp.]MBO9604012.1 hypothetical protein [Novosphingobium sp.]